MRRYGCRIGVVGSRIFYKIAKIKDSIKVKGLVPLVLVHKLVVRNSAVFSSKKSGDKSFVSDL